MVKEIVIISVYVTSNENYDNCENTRTAHYLQLLKQITQNEKKASTCKSNCNFRLQIPRGGLTNGGDDSKKKSASRVESMHR